MNHVKIFCSTLLCIYLLFGSVYGAVVINEFEENPPGTQDGGNEWVELYNDDGSEVDISGWKLIDGYYGKEVTIPSGEKIIGGEYYVVTWTNGTLVNTHPENITLYDHTGFEIDKTRTVINSGNDEKCWARIPNGHDTDNDSDWELTDETKGGNNDGNENGTDPIPEFPTFIVPVLVMLGGLSLAGKFAPQGL